MAAAGGVVLGSATFLVAVSGLLAPPLYPPRRCSPSFPGALIAAPSMSRRGSSKKRASNRTASKTPPARARERSMRKARETRMEEGTKADPGRGRSGEMGVDTFDAGAWKNIPSSPQAAPTAVPASTDPTAVPATRKTATYPLRHPPFDGQERTGVGGRVVDLDVEKLPTFVFFGRGADGKLWREDVVGGGDARSCAAELQEKFASLWPPGAASSRPSPTRDDSCLAPSGAGGGRAGGTGGKDGGDGLFGSGGANGDAGGRDAGNTGAGSGVGSETDGITAGIRNNNFAEISSREDLLRVIGGEKKRRGLVVVMYHARWCRKCAYLTPVFRRLASSGTEPPVADGHLEDSCGDDAAGSDSSSSSSSSSSSGASTGGLLFCRVDVADPSWGRRRDARGSPAPAEPVAATSRAAVLGGSTAAAAAAAAAADADVAGPRQQARESRGVGGLDPVLPAADGAVSDGAASAASAPAAPAEMKAAAGIATAETDLLSLHAGSPAVEDCDACGRSGFVPCGECEGRGAVARSSPDGKHTMAVTCPVCVGYKRLRCPSCGGKCYMCE
ncbi:unnamed protein product [Hapterophycus canaliculatus]